MKVGPDPLHILIIEDDEAIRTTLAGVLELEGHVVTGSANGKEAIELLESGEFKADLIIVDYWMPVMDGLEFLAWLRANPTRHSTPAYLTTGMSQAASELATGSLRKPFHLEKLFAIIATHQPPPPHPSKE